MTTTATKTEFAVLEGKGRAHTNYSVSPDYVVYENCDTLDQAITLVSQKSEDVDDRITVFNVGILNNITGQYDAMYDESGSEIE